MNWWISLTYLLLGSLEGLYEVAAQAPATEYLVGVGIGDITGTSVETTMFGYADAKQVDQGIHTRLFSRAFIFAEKNGRKDSNRVVFVSIDAGMIDFSIKREVLKRLQKKYGPIYTGQNVLISATHTHSGPGGFMQTFSSQQSTKGFISENYEATVAGISESIERAHDSLQPGKLFMAADRIVGANINRSPSSYTANPQNERDRYSMDGDTDKVMVLLRIETSNGKELGMLNWFPVHGTSMNKTNLLISGDNKGYASMQVEYEKNVGLRPGQGKFVAGFAQSNAGDVSPNTSGPKCHGDPSDPKNGQSCDGGMDTCKNSTTKLNNMTNCYALGPGKDGDMDESTEIIGGLQAKKALELMNTAAAHKFPVYGAIQSVHQFINMTNQQVQLTYENGVTETVTTCPMALGYSFAAGTTDGPAEPLEGGLTFYQGDTVGTPAGIRQYFGVPQPSEAQVKCHSPKPILINYAEQYYPYDWVATVTEPQILRVGNLYIIGFPAEITTMAGRRVKQAVAEIIRRERPNAPNDAVVVLAGLTSMYTHYVTTYEEYQRQRYEAASTLFGPHTLAAYLAKFRALTSAMLRNVPVNSEVYPPDLSSRQVFWGSLNIFDLPPTNRSFGDCTNQPPSTVSIGSTIKVAFASASPKNHLMRGSTYFAVERQDQSAGKTVWNVVAIDADWSTKFNFNRGLFGTINALSTIEFRWNTAKHPAPLREGVYRIRHFGHYRPIPQHSAPVPYNGSTNTFTLIR